MCIYIYKLMFYLHSALDLPQEPSNTQITVLIPTNTYTHTHTHTDRTMDGDEF